MTDFIVTQCTEDKLKAISHKIIDEAKIRAIGNGVDSKKFSPVSAADRAEILKELRIPSGALVVGVVCRMVREKGVVELLDAAMQLAELHPTAHFLFIGERIPSERDTQFGDEWNLALQRLGTRLIATGFRADVSRMLGAMDIFCLPSYREGMPRSIIEAMMMGLPVVATNIRGAREEVVPVETGFLVPVRDPVALANAINRLISDPLLRNKMGVAGRQRALSLYEENNVLSFELEIISELISSRLKAQFN